MVRPHVPEYQVRSAGADTVQSSPFARGFYELRVRSEPEIIIAAESDVLATVHLYMRALGRLEYAATAAQAFGVERGKLRRE
jgi:hypothetical protein